jgi:glycosyltransferase involved in cell wall biosynthesis
MRILFVHQNFPGQFKHLAPALVNSGHEITALCVQKNVPENWQGIKIIYYQTSRSTTPGIHPWTAETETKIIRGEACFRAALQLKTQGYTPDMVIAHPHWGETLFIKEVWPEVKLGIYCEFFYHPHGAETGFDPEFPHTDPGFGCKLRTRTINNLMHFEIADAGISPTYWQASTFPARFGEKITVVHDGIDTDVLRPNSGVGLTLNNVPLSRKNQVITFVNRNLEPLRGYHIFMRALPKILKENPWAIVLIIGGSGIGYGKAPPEGTTWKEIFLNEVKNQLDVKRVFFLGKITYPHYMTVLQLSTVHVYLTYPSVLSWSLLEAMSMGCTIVASDTQPLHEAITQNKTGRLVNFFDIEGIANQVTELLGNAAERQRLGTNAREFAVKNFDFKTACLPKQLAWVNSLYPS